MCARRSLHPKEKHPQWRTEGGRNAGHDDRGRKCGLREPDADPDVQISTHASRGKAKDAVPQQDTPSGGHSIRMEQMFLPFQDEKVLFGRTRLILILGLDHGVWMRIIELPRVSMAAL